MNKVQKIDYIKGIEEYLEKNHTYELFEHLMRQLIIHEPEDPQNFLIEKLKNPDGTPYYENSKNYKEKNFLLLDHPDQTLES